MTASDTSAHAGRFSRGRTPQRCRSTKAVSGTVTGRSTICKAAALTAATAKLRAIRLSFGSTERRSGRRYSPHSSSPNAPTTSEALTHTGSWVVFTDCLPCSGATLNLRKMLSAGHSPRPAKDIAAENAHLGAGRGGAAGEDWPVGGEVGGVAAGAD